MKILVVDDEKLTGSLISEYLKDDPRVSDVAYTNDTNNLIDIIKNGDFDLVFLDLFMPNDILVTDFIGLKLLSDIKSIFKKVKVMILSSHYDYNLIEKAENLKCDGYLNKNITSSNLNDAITHLEAGRMYYCPECKHVRMNQYEEHDNVDYELIKEKITPREKQILILLSEGWNLKEISHKLDISTNTVEYHKKNLFKKFGHNKVVAIVSVAIRHNII